MVTKVYVPLLGEGVDEVIVSKWLKQEGDSIDELEPLLEVNTDKVDTEIPAPASGTLLKINIKEGTVAKVGEILAFIGQGGEALEAGSPPELQEGLAAEISDVSPETLSPHSTVSNLKSEINNLKSDSLGFISPVVAKIAAENDVNLGQVKGTGLNGRITKTDVLAYVESGLRKTAAKSRSKTNPKASDQIINHSAIRKNIAEHMLMSKHTSPHVLPVMEADMSKVVAHRKQNKETYSKDNVNLTFT
ncbi:MAG: biotin/lipoyl-containing protein, partial [Anaerolineae bacterium]|nr:biotin/lipoyl-containing protein [Anaerolineae bacterium]